MKARARTRLADQADVAHTTCNVPRGMQRTGVGDQIHIEHEDERCRDRLERLRVEPELITQEEHGMDYARIVCNHAC